MKIAFFGTAGFCPTHNSCGVIIDTLVAAGYKPVVLVTANDKPAGKKQQLTPPLAKLTALKHGIEIIQSEKLNKDVILRVQKINPDVIILAAYGILVPKEILEIPKYGALCVHPSLLPQFRGPSPVQNAILEGKKETGITVIKMDQEIDHGPIIAQKQLPILGKPTVLELSEQLAPLAGNLLIEIIPKLASGEIILQEQDDSKATYTKIFEKKDGAIDWNNSAVYIERQVRALNPWPSTYTKFKIQNSKSETNSKFKILKILKASVLEQTKRSLVKRGLVFLTQDKKIAVHTGKDALVIEKLQLEGGKAMNARDFILGYRGFIGIILE